MRVLITGGSGFIGSNLIPALARDHEVLSIDPLPPRNPSCAGHWLEGSVLDGDWLRRTMRNFAPERVLHLGARTDLRGKSLSDYEANTTGTSNVIEAVRRTDTVAHTVYTSSRLVFAIDHRPASSFDYKPSTHYGVSKVRAEEIVRERAHEAGPWSIVRPTSIWGPWFEEPYRDFFDTIAAGRYVKMRGKDPLKSFGFVGNAVHQLTRILEMPPEVIDARVYWLSDYDPLRLSDWADAISEELGRRRPLSAPFWLVRGAALMGDVAQIAGIPRVPITSFRLRNLITDMVYDTSETREIVGELPYSMRDGVRETISWYRSHAR